MIPDSSLAAGPGLEARDAHISALRAAVASVEQVSGEYLPFGVAAIDERLAGGGIALAGVHEFAPASPSLSDEAATTLFLAGIAGRLARQKGASLVWVRTGADLYAPGLEQAGLGPDEVIHIEAGNDKALLALGEDALRSDSFAAVAIEARKVSGAAIRRLQLAAAHMPLFLFRGWARRDQGPLDEPSLAVTRWSIGSVASAPLAVPGVGRARWSVELVRQRGGQPFSCLVEACDDSGRIALPATVLGSEAEAGGAVLKAA